jgi:hypothetical protein
MIFCATLSGLCGMALIKSSQLIPGNHNFDLRYEFSNIAKHYTGYYGYITIAVLFNLSMISQLIPEIIQSAAVGDMLIQQLFSKTCGVTFFPSLGWSCVQGDDAALLFGANSIVLTLGMVLVGLISIPMGYFNLDDNMHIQAAAAIALVLMILAWVYVFLDQGLVADRVPFLGTDYSNVLGVIVFNYSFAASLPSWINEKCDNTSIRKATWIPLIIGTIMFVVVGVLGGMAYAPFFDTDDDILTKLDQKGKMVGKITYYLFPLIVNLTSIPVYSIMIRYNLQSTNLVTPRVASFIGVVCPWILTFLFYTGDGFQLVVQWTGTTVNGVVSFIIPLYIYILAVSRYGVKHGEGLFADDDDGTVNLLSESNRGISEEAEGSDESIVEVTSTASRLSRRLSYNATFIEPLTQVSKLTQIPAVAISYVIIVVYVGMILGTIVLAAENSN